MTTKWKPQTFFKWIKKFIENKKDSINWKAVSQSNFNPIKDAIHSGLIADKVPKGANNHAWIVHFNNLLSEYTGEGTETYEEYFLDFAEQHIPIKEEIFKEIEEDINQEFENKKISKIQEQTEFIKDIPEKILIKLRNKYPNIKPSQYRFTSGQDPHDQFSKRLYISVKGRKGILTSVSESL